MSTFRVTTKDGILVLEDAMSLTEFQVVYPDWVVEDITPAPVAEQKAPVEKVSKKK